MGFEIPIDVDFPNHPKAIRLIGILGDRADVYPLRLWMWCAKFAKNGVIRGGAEQVELACSWKGKAGKLHGAMIEAGFIDQDGITVHDWYEWAGRKLEQYEKKKRNQREKDRQKKEAEYAAYSTGPREQNSGNLPAEFRQSANSVGGSLPTANETKRNETKQHETKQNETTPPAALSISELAQKATFKQGKGTSPNRMADWHKHIEDLQKLGFSLELIDAEIERKDRMSTEPPWEFLKRLVANSSKITEKTPEQLREERIAADNERARQLREKRKAQTV